MGFGGKKTKTIQLKSVQIEKNCAVIAEYSILFRTFAMFFVE